MKITFVDGDGWQGLYINGKIVTQTHHLTVVDVLNAIGVEYDYIVPDDEWLCEVGQLPEKLSKVLKQQ